VGHELRSQTCCLQGFDRVVDREMQSPGSVSRELIEAYLRTLAHLQPITRRLRLSTIRQFLLYLRQFDPATYIPDRSLEPGRSSPRLPYIFTEDEVRALTQAAYEYPNRYRARRWPLYPTLFGLLYVTGMRISEALSLTLADLDLGQALLRIRKTKFHKARLIPLHPSSCGAIHLLRAGNDLSVIRSWLGHVSIMTTDHYTDVDIEMKRQALEASDPFPTGKHVPSWKKDYDLIAWLEAL